MLSLLSSSSAVYVVCFLVVLTPRWFVLTDKILRYYESSDKMKEPLGVIDLSIATELYKARLLWRDLIR